MCDFQFIRLNPWNVYIVEMDCILTSMHYLFGDGWRVGGGVILWYPYFLIDAPKDEGGKIKIKKKELFNIWSTKLIPLRENEM